MKAHTRLGMTEVSGWAKGMTYPRLAIALWLTVIGLYFASFLPASFPKHLESALFPQPAEAAQCSRTP